MKLPVLSGARTSSRLADVIRDSERGGVLASRHGAAGGAFSGFAPAHVEAALGDDGAAGGAEYPTSPAWDALREVMDPELPVSLVDLGLIVDVREAGSTVEVDMTFTAMACPCMGFIKLDAEDRLLEVPGIERVTIHEVWTPAWDRTRITAVGKAAMKAAGVGC